MSTDAVVIEDGQEAAVSIVEADEDAVSVKQPQGGGVRKRAQHIWALALVAVAAISIFVLAPLASSPDTLGSVRESLDAQQATVTGLAAGATALSAGLSLVPDDALSPVANQLADVSGWFMVIIAVIILQKILVTVAGSIAFTLIIPLACVLGIAFVYARRDGLRSLAVRFAAFGLVLCLAVPGSILVSGALTATYTDISTAAAEADDAADAAASEEPPAAEAPVDDGDDSFLDSVGDWFADAAGNVGDAVGTALNSINDIKDEAVGALNSYMEKFALLIVTTCVMPLLVMLLFGWVIKLLFSVDIAVGALGRKAAIAGEPGCADGGSRRGRPESEASGEELTVRSAPQGLERRKLTCHNSSYQGSFLT